MEGYEYKNEKDGGKNYRENKSYAPRLDNKTRGGEGQNR
jgi:hypothetical protein